jgi:ABC-2 type transport system permease protein
MGQTEVQTQNFRELLVIPPNYVRTGSFTIYRSASNGIFEEAGQSHDYAFTAALSKGLIGRRLPPALARRIVEPIGNTYPTVLEWDSQAQRFVRPDPIQQAAKFFVPYAFSMLLMMCIGIGTGYLLHGIIDEKENRVMEILLSSVTHEQLLRGKLIGLGGAGLTQIGVWVAMAGIPAAIALSMLPTSLRIAPLTLCLCLVLFALGFALYGSLMAGVGSLTSSWRESQQITSITIMVAIIPIILMTTILEQPNGPVARGLSWFPLTAPVTLMMRVATGDVAAWDWGLGLALLLVAIWLVQKLTAKLFRLGLLMYGKPPTVQEVWRWLKAA